MCGGLFASFIMLVCGQYDILYANLKNLGEVTIEKISEGLTRMKFFDKNVEERQQYIASIENADNDDEIAVIYKDEHEAIAECIKHHQIILEFCKMLQDVYSIFSTFKMFYSSKKLFLKLNLKLIFYFSIFAVFLGLCTSQHGN